MVNPELPPILAARLREALERRGDSSRIQDLRPVSGGCISQTCKLTTGRGAYFLKWNTDNPPGMFASEELGLNLLRQAGIRTPQVLAATDGEGELPGFILQEWIEAGPWQAPAYRLGEQLALVHQSRADVGAYGLESDNLLGLMPQQNGWDDDWVRFFRERRLRPQVEMGESLWPASMRQRLDRLMDRLEGWVVGVHRVPSLLHGDLWSGNILADSSGEPVLIDPAAYYGDREAEIAYTRLFGGFPQKFYDAYMAFWPLPRGYEERQDLYNLYHLLNHANHGFAGYLEQAEAVARRYVG